MELSHSLLVENLARFYCVFGAYKLLLVLLLLLWIASRFLVVLVVMCSCCCCGGCYFTFSCVDLAPFFLFFFDFFCSWLLQYLQLLGCFEDTSSAGAFSIHATSGAVFGGNSKEVEAAGSVYIRTQRDNLLQQTVAVGMRHRSELGGWVLSLRCCLLLVSFLIECRTRMAQATESVFRFIWQPPLVVRLAYLWALGKCQQL